MIVLPKRNFRIMKQSVLWSDVSVWTTGITAQARVTTIAFQYSKLDKVGSAIAKEGRTPYILRVIQLLMLNSKSSF